MVKRKFSKTTKSLKTFAFFFFLHFISVLTAPIVRNNHILTFIYFIFLKKRPRPDLKVFQYPNLQSVKDQRTSYQVSPTLVLFCKLVASILD